METVLPVCTRPRKAEATGGDSRYRTSGMRTFFMDTLSTILICRCWLCDLQLLWRALLIPSENI